MNIKISGQNETAETNAYSVIADQLEVAILDGRYGESCPFPSSRTLASQFGVSRSTILTAFSILSRKGLMRISHGKAPQIATIKKQNTGSEISFAPAELNQEEPSRVNENDEHLASDNSQMLVRLSPHLPTRKWFGLISNLARKAHGQGHSSDSDVSLELKVALRNYLNRQREINTRLDQIFIFENTASALVALATAFSLGEENRLLVDTPALANNVRQLARFSNRIEAVNLETLIAESNKIGDNKTSSSGLLYTTPSTRLGSMRSVTRLARLAILDWAKKNNCHILEHDYGHEYCSGPNTHPALFSLDQSSNVIYLTDFSASLSPLTNLCAAVVPPALINLMKRYHCLEQSSCSLFEAQALTNLLNTGYLERHSRKAGQYSMQNLAEFKRLLGTLEIAKFAQLKLIKSGKEAILELAVGLEVEALAPAFNLQLLTPASKIFGLDSSETTKYLVYGDRLDEESRNILLACLAKCQSTVMVSTVYTTAMTAAAAY